jgi:hypothetical protein
VPAPATKTKTVICPDCQTECVLTQAEDGVYEGVCKKDDCGTDVGWCYEQAKRNASLKKFEAMQSGGPEDPPEPKKKRRFGFR